MNTHQAGITQRVVTLRPEERGIYLMTRKIYQECQELKDVRAGMVNFFLQSTHAALSINENADPTVRTDLEGAVPRANPAVRAGLENDRISALRVQTRMFPDQLREKLLMAVIAADVFVAEQRSGPAGGFHSGPETNLPIFHAYLFMQLQQSRLKTSLVGVSLDVPIHNGQLAFGTWQGLYLCDWTGGGPGGSACFEKLALGGRAGKAGSSGLNLVVTLT
eukprot:gene24217-29413_t